MVGDSVDLIILLKVVAALCDLEEEGVDSDGEECTLFTLSRTIRRALARALRNLAESFASADTSHRAI
jgi:hypothetical protein